MKRRQNAHTVATKLATTIARIAPDVKSFEELDRETISAAMMNGLEARSWLRRTKRQSTIESAWLEAWYDAQDIIADTNNPAKYPTPIYREADQQKERDQSCEQYIQEVLEIIYNDDYFDTRLSKASRIALVAKTWGAVGEFQAHYRYCDNCEQQFKHDALYSEGYHNSKILCRKCNSNSEIEKRKIGK